MELSSSSQKSHSRCSVDRFVPCRRRRHTFASLCIVSSLLSVKVTCSSFLFRQGVSFVHHPQMSASNDCSHILCLHVCMGSPWCQVTLLLGYCSEQWYWSRLSSPKGSLDGGTALEVLKLSVLFLCGNRNEGKRCNLSCGLEKYYTLFSAGVGFNTLVYFIFWRWQKKCS